MRLSCGLIPGPDCVAQAQLAEELGYERVWLADSIAIYEDIWIWLGQLATATDRIGLGTGVLVPHTRHVMTTASAIATMEELAPGRMAYAFGTGASARVAARFYGRPHANFSADPCRNHGHRRYFHGGPHVTPV